MLGKWRALHVLPHLHIAARTPSLQQHLVAHGRRLLSSAASNRDVVVYNSLTGTHEPLPRAHAATPNVLKWYACGPTVYDRAHLGHARAYVSQDILRRILEKRFQYNVCLVMGVTDVDDKIIQRAKERGIPFAELARDEERAFFADMAALNVQPPTAVTRVSEHMDEIIAYIQRIEENGFAYAADDGSGVYFHTAQLGDAYGKLDPARHAHVHASDVQPSDVETDSPGTKRDRRDFALWKAAKDPDEPSWDSPWGRGRPGWHIECSAMTHHVLGAQLDVHSGGIDLKFPHHNNEIAQCDAHRAGCCHRHPPDDAKEGAWCRHFVHFGHLYIEGLKMSKSLKNFIAIRDFLDAPSSADHFRLFCLQFKYRANLHFASDRVRDAAVVADRIKRFFRSLDAIGTAQRGVSTSSTAKKCNPVDLALLELLLSTRTNVDAALADDFDTPRALALVLELIARSNEYLLERVDGPSEVLHAVSTYVLEILDLFGLDGLHRESAHVPALFALGKTLADPAAAGATATAATSALDSASADAILQALVRFRAAVREQALLDPKQNKTILALCDALRNDELPPLGVHVEDLAPGRSIVKVLSKAEREAAAAAEDCATEAADATLSQLQLKQQAFEALMQIAPTDLFRLAPEYVGKYAAFDADGVPTLDAATQEPLTKSQRKKLVKKLEKHTKSYAKYWDAKQ